MDIFRHYVFPLDVWVIGLEATSHFIVIQQRRPGRTQTKYSPGGLVDFFFYARDEIWIVVLDLGIVAAP